MLPSVSFSPLSMGVAPHILVGPRDFIIKGSLSGGILLNSGIKVFKALLTSCRPCFWAVSCFPTLLKSPVYQGFWSVDSMEYYRVKMTMWGNVWGMWGEDTGI